MHNSMFQCLNVISVISAKNEVVMHIHCATEIQTRSIMYSNFKMFEYFCKFREYYRAWHWRCLVLVDGFWIPTLCKWPYSRPLLFHPTSFTNLCFYSLKWIFIILTSFGLVAPKWPSKYICAAFSKSKNIELTTKNMVLTKCRANRWHEN